VIRDVLVIAASSRSQPAPGLRSATPSSSFASRRRRKAAPSCGP
jgi:hypothetical protein